MCLEAFTSARLMSCASVSCRSLGSGPTWPTQGPQATLNVALNNLVAAGLVVVVSAGNDGGLGPTSLGMCVLALRAGAQATAAMINEAGCCGRLQTARECGLRPCNCFMLHAEALPWAFTSCVGTESQPPQWHQAPSPLPPVRTRPSPFMMLFLNPATYWCVTSGLNMLQVPVGFVRRAYIS